MIIHRGQRIQYVVIGYDRDLIGDAEVKLHTVVDLKTAKHNARAHKELVSVGALAARPLRVVEGEFRPEIFTNMILQGRAGDERRADVVPLVSRERIANRSLDIKITPADATRDGGGDNPSRPVGKGGNAGWRLKSQKNTENIVSIFFVGAEQPLFDGDEVRAAAKPCPQHMRRPDGPRPGKRLDKALAD